VTNLVSAATSSGAPQWLQATLKVAIFGGFSASLLISAAKYTGCADRAGYKAIRKIHAQD